MNKSQLMQELRRDEGEVLHAYTDSLGYLTIGVGRLIDQRRGGGITAEESALLLTHDVDTKTAELEQKVAFWTSLDDARQRALCNMAFQLGTPGLLKFHHMLLAMAAQDWPRAHNEALNSRWATQTPERAQRVAAMILHGGDA